MKIQYGLTGNWYVTSENKEDLVGMCVTLNRKISCIQWSSKYNTWVIRVKDKKQKLILKIISKNLHN
jgi:hypothetical protein